MVWERDGMAGKEDAKVHSACLPLSLDAGETTCFCRAPGLISEQSDNEHSLHRSALLQRCASAVQHCRLFDSRLHSGCCGSEDYTEMAEWPLPPAPDPDVSSVAVHGFRWCDSGTGHLGSGDECSLLCASCSVSSMIRTLGREGTCMSVQVIHAAQYSASRSPVACHGENPLRLRINTRDTLLLRAIGAALMVIGSQHHYLSDVSARDVGCRLKAEIQMAIIAAAGPHCRLDPLKTEVVKFP